MMTMVVNNIVLHFNWHLYYIIWVVIIPFGLVSQVRNCLVKDKKFLDDFLLRVLETWNGIDRSNPSECDTREIKSNIWLLNHEDVL